MYIGPKKEKIVTAYKPIEFPADTAEELSISLDVENIAKRNARQDLPPSDATSVDAHELSFMQEITRQAIRAKALIQHNATYKKGELEKLSIERDLADLISVPETFTHSINLVYEEKEAEIRELKTQYNIALDDLQAFKRLNGLRREADFPPSKTKAIGLLLLMLIVETALNANFFAHGSDLGLLGGASQALIISLLNVSIGAMAGAFILRWKNHVSAIKRVSGLVLTIFVGFFAFIGNLLVGHYRDAMGINPDEGEKIAVQHFLKGYFALQDFSSWVLVAIGLIVFFIALFKGYTWDDVYPGFGRVARRVQIAKDELLATKDDLLERLQEIYQEHEENSEKCYDKIRRDKQSLENIVTSMRTEFDLYRSYIDNLSNAYNYIVTLYRQTNKKERTSSPPLYFSEAISISLDRLIDLEEPIDQRLLFDNCLTQASTELSENKNKMLTAQAEKVRLINEICKI